MSIKRTKVRTYSPGRRGSAAGDSPFSFSKPQEPEKSWEEHMEGKGDEEFAPYTLKASFDRGALITHTKFGKGVVLKVEDAHLVVLFKEGEKKLGTIPRSTATLKGPAGPRG